MPPLIYGPDTSPAESWSLRLGDSGKLPFPDEAFDKVFCRNEIYFWGRPEIHLKEIYRLVGTRWEILRLGQDNGAHGTIAVYPIWSS